ncbi:IclR family transcriptional regulator [Leifsonia poae]|uniref:IclR family transcriptional regulator n=1 Tax=Leifsonia poae TaxID=110933 RepID=UPI001CBB7004|nr:IclR family transcriptional regulator C-terminal domain-containing protein [Leifsonia poae]
MTSAGGAYSSLARGLEVLEAIGSGERSVASLSRRFELDQSAMSRLVASLEAGGWVTRAENGPVLGPRAAVLGAGSAQRSLSRRAERLTHVISGLTGCDAVASVLSGSRGYYLAVSKGPEDLYDYVPVFDPAPVWASAVGQVMASQLEDEAALALLPPDPLPATGPNTITTASRFRDRLQRIREQGSLIEVEEYLPGFACLAVPWPGALPLQGALACVSVVERITASTALIERVLRAAAKPGSSERTIIAAAAAH